MNRQKWMTLLIVFALSLMIATTPVFGQDEPVEEPTTTAEATTAFNPGTTLIILLAGIGAVTVVGGATWGMESHARRNKKSS